MNTFCCNCICIRILFQEIQSIRIRNRIHFLVIQSIRICIRIHSRVIRLHWIIQMNTFMILLFPDDTDMNDI